jgi:carbamoyltransferase
MRAALEKSGLGWTKETDIDRTVAQLLARGKVVARFSGRMEYGLRALGNRSILFHTRDREVNDWLNKRLRRSEFMPFAPVTLAGYAGECYEASPLLTDNMRFMTVCAPCTERMKRLSPGVVHIDGTARPQLVNAEENPGYHRVLSEYHSLTGVPSLINTSFNMHEEPIVCTPGDALAAFTASRLDHCALGPYLVSASRKPDSASTR